LQRYPGWHGVAVLLLSLAGIVALSWRLATDRLVQPLLSRQRFPIGFAMAMAIPTLNGLVVLAVSLALDPPALASVAGICPWLIGVILCVKAVVGGVAFRAAWRRGLVEGRFLAEFAIIAAAFAGVILMWVWLLLPESGLPLSRGVFLLGALALAPFGRFALVPL